MINDCTTCQLADWKRTKAVQLHPSGDGRCLWEGWKEWKIPKAFYFTGLAGPRPYGGFISRRKPETDCPFYQPIATPTPPQP